MKNKIIIIAAIVIAVLGTVVFWKYQTKQKEIKKEAEKAAQTTFPAINGVPVTEAIANSRPLAVVVENHPDARPQSGLYFADVVYETLAEGGITRFLAIFQTQTPKEIGPVRSARPYFNNIADQWHAAFAHVGGSALALSELDSDVYKNVTDINQFSFGDYFYRSKERVAPHNAYTSTELLRSLLTKKKWDKWDKRALGDFETIPTEKLQTAVTKISVKFFSAGFNDEFDFDPTTGLYNRNTGGQPTVDAINNSQISPRNVLIEFVDDYSVPMEPANGLGLHLDEDGRALLFTGGNITEGTWRYKDGFTQYVTTVKDAQGNEQTQNMKFQPGQTWIVLMPKSLTDNVTWK